MEERRESWRLLNPGWAGDLSEEELEYIRDHLKECANCRRRWGLTGKRLSAIAIRRVARDGVGDPLK